MNSSFFSKLVYDGNDDGNVSTYKILGSLEILAIKNREMQGLPLHWMNLDIFGA